jgi:anti-sigma regulatory factor (Ser/Thr protein kinase)
MVETPISHSFAAEADQLEEVRRFVSRAAEEAGLPEHTADDLVLAVNEAATNSILHSGTERFHIRWIALDDRVEIEIQDEGLFKRRIRVAALDGAGGLGIPLMMSLTDEFELHEGTPGRPGTRTRLVKFHSAD